MSRTILPVICLIAVLVLVTDCGFCLAQNVALDTPNAPETQWDNTYGPVEGHSIIQTSDGGYAVGGTYATYQSATRGPGHFENYTAVLIKTDSSGTIQWNKPYNIGWGVTSIIQTEDNGYVFTGYGGSWYSSFDRLWLARTDASGNVQWNNTYLGNAYQAASKVALAQDGYFLAGFIQIEELGNTSAVVIKVDGNGNLQWHKTYGDNAVFFDCIETNDGGLTLLGMTDYGGVSARSPQPLLLKIDADGNVLWMKTYNDYKIEELYSVCATQDGGYFLAGSESASGNTGSYFSLLVKTNSTGDLQWNKTYDPSIWNCDQVFRKITPTNDNNYYVGGIVDHQQVLLLKIDDSGSISWRRLFTYYDANLSLATAILNSLIAANDNSLVFAGIKIGDGSIANYVWAVKLAPEPTLTPTLTPTATVASNQIPERIWIISAVLAIIILASALLIIERKKHKNL